MRMDEFMKVLQTKLATQQPNYPDNAESNLEVLFDIYNESSGFDNITTKADFEQSHKFLVNRSMTEIDVIISMVNRLCRNMENWDLKPG